ncbi:MAG: DUF748 domain-containing protein [Desulfocapsa sp.]|nr:DUF748 domain-containing protein [Desulfocapsa sp.]
MSDRFGNIPINSDTPSSPPPAAPDKRAQTRPTQRKKQRNSRIPLFLLVTVFLVGSYFLAGLHLAPLLIQKYLPRYVHRTTGLELAIGSIQVNPLNFQLTLTQLRADIPGSVASQPLLQSRSLFIDLDLTSLLRKSFVCDKLTIQGLELGLIRSKDNKYNIPALSRLSSEQDHGEIINFAKLPFLFSLNNIDISDSRILFDDRVTGSTHTVEQLHLAIPALSNFSFQSDNYIQPHFSAIINGSKLQLRGKAVQLADNRGFQTRLSCSIHDLDLVPYFSYLPATFPLTFSQGMADTMLEIAFSPNSEQKSRLSIDIRMTATDLEMKGKNYDMQLALPSMEMEATLAPISKRLHIKSIITKGMHLTGSKKAAAEMINNFFSLSQNNDPPKSELTIDQLLADQGKVTFYEDQQRKSNVSNWNTLQLSITNFTTAQASGTLQLSGEQEKGGGNFSWKGAFTESGAIQGKLLLNSFPAMDLIHLFSPVPENSVQGTAVFSGGLSFSPLQKGANLYTLDNAMLEIHDLKLTQDKGTWLEAGSVRFTRLNRTDGEYNLGNIFLKDSTLNLNTKKLPPLFSRLFIAEKRPQIKGIDFTGDIHISTDKDQKAPLHLSDVHLQVSSLDKSAVAENLTFAGLLPSGGRINAKGMLTLGPTQIQAHTSFSNVDSSLLLPFFQEWPLLKNSRSRLHGEGTYRFPDTSFQGSLKLTDTLLQNGEEKPFLSWDLAEFSKLDYRFSPLSLQAENLSLDAPLLHWQRASEPPFQQLQTAVQGLFSDQTENTKLFPVSIKKISFRNGTMTYLDQRLSPPWQTKINTIEGRINNFNTGDNGLSSFTLSGTVEDSPLNLAGTATFFRTPPEAHTRLKLTGFPLASFRKQLAGTAIDPEAATLFLQMDMVEEQSHISGTSEMTINNLTPTTATSDTALPLALLKNTEGSFPLTLSMDDSNQSLFQKSLNSFQTLLIKASYAPLLLDNNFADLQGNNLVFFHPGTNTLSAAGKETLLRFAELLTQHPGLGLSVTGMADGKTDRNVLLTALAEKEQQRVDMENNRREEEYRKKQQHPPVSETGNTLKEETIAKEDLEGFVPLLPEPVHIKDEELLDLARERTLVVYDFCIDSLGLEPLRISLAGKGEISTTTPANGAQINIKTIPTDVE